MADDIIRKACFELAVDLMWENEDLTIDRTEAHMVELSIMVDEFYRIALFQFELIKN